MEPGLILGTEVAGRYRLLRHLGDGPLGASFEAVAGFEGTDKPICAKVVRRSLVSDDALSRYLQTATAVSTVRNVHLVATRDVAYDLSRGLVVFARDLLAGPDLASLLSSNGPLAPSNATRIVAQACAGVASLHASDLVHRNLKPSNVFLDADAAGGLTVRVCDPAVGRGVTAMSRAAHWEHLRYASPEQVRAKDASHHVDGRTDVYSLGAILYALLTGTPPHVGATSVESLVEALEAREVDAVQDLAPWVPASLAHVVEQALEREPARRFPSAHELGAALRELTGGDPSVTRAALSPVDATLRSNKAARHARASPRPRLEPGAESIHADSERDPLIGHALGGRYRVLGILGRGGMGAVYEVEGPGGVHFAAKVISREAAGTDTQLVARFIREAHAITKIDDAHVTRTIELGTDMTLGLPFLVMELLRGKDLGAFCKERGALAPVPLMRVVSQAAEGLRAAHERGIVHRDVKPANIFLHTQPDGEISVKLCDFGLAKALQGAGGEAPSHELTYSGGMLGTPMYMSPEHATDPRSVDARTDIWSLCASAYEGLSGQKLWGNAGSTLAELMMAICTRPFPPLSEVAPWVSPELAAIVEKGLAREPAKRWPDAQALLGALAPHLGEAGARVTMEDLAPVAPELLAARVLSTPRRMGGPSTTLAPNSESAQTAPSAPVTGGTRAGMRIAAVGLAAVVAGGLGSWLWRSAHVAPVPLAVDGALAAPARECRLRVDCVKLHAGQPWTCGPEGRCAPLESEDCKVLADPGAIEDEATLWLGTMFPMTGDLAQVGQQCTNAVELGRRELSAVSAGLPPNGDAPGGPIGIVACDDARNADLVAAHLVHDVHVPAVIGFRASNELIDLASKIFVPNRTLAIATLNHSPLITKVPQPAEAPRLVWRLSGSYGQMPEPMTLLIQKIVEPDLRAAGGLGPHARLRAAALFEETATGLGAESALLDDLRINGMRALDNKDDFRVFRCRAADTGSACDQSADSIVAFRPHVILFALPVAMLVPAFRAIEERWPQGAPFRPRYLGDELDALAPILDARPESRRRFFALTPPYNDASAKLTRSYNAAFHENVEESHIPAQAYDAFYLLAFAAYASRERPRDGAALARAFPRLLPPADPIEVGPSKLLDAFSRLSGGGHIALAGASALVDLDLSTGERLMDFDVLCPGVRPDGHVAGPVPSGLRYDHLNHRIVGTRSCP